MKAKYDYTLLVRLTEEELNEAILDMEKHGWHQDGGVFLQKQAR